MLNKLKNLFKGKSEIESVRDEINSLSVLNTDKPEEKQFTFSLYFEGNSSANEYIVKYYDFQGDFIRMTLLDNTTVVQSSKKLERFTIKENETTA